MARSSKPDLGKVLSVLATRYPKFRWRKDMPMLEQAMFLIFQKDSSDEHALACIEKLRREFVDWNEMRVSQIPELARVLSSVKKDPNRIGKLQQLREFTNQVFSSRHSMNLDPMREWEGEKLHKFFMSLECLDPYMIDLLVMFNAKDEEIPLNLGVHRVLQRLGIASKTTAPTKQQSELDSLAPSKERPVFYALLGRLAHDICHPKDPLCSECPLLSACKYGQTLLQSSKSNKTAV